MVTDSPEYCAHLTNEVARIERSRGPASPEARSLAERLEVSEDTIKSHRKHIYTKLDICAQSELFALFIDSLAEAQGVLSKDPLESYMSKNR